ncbi:MAG: hypothetical protein RJB66_683 [Pseudomonadota bacterium]|jgi:aminoglycoside/choline kinase family phosphotransferase
MKQELKNYITELLASHLANREFQVIPLVGDASSRRYSRIVSGTNSWVLMEWEPYDPENYSLLSVQKHFKKHNVLVPEVVAFSGEHGVIIYEDLGDVTLEQEFYKTRNPYGVLGFYRMSLDELLKIHLMATKDRSPCIAFNYEFDVEKLSWELNFMKQHFLEGVLGFKDLGRELDQEFIKLTTLLQQKNKYIQHRDYHSRNIMVTDNKIRVIDFQDARLGLVQYDLVSLLRDAYVPVPETLEKELLEYYLYRAKADFNQEWNTNEFEFLYEIQSLQRLLKAVGSFSSFWMLRKDKRYLKYISGTMKRVKKGMELTNEFPNLAKALSNSGAYDWTEEKT